LAFSSCLSEASGFKKRKAFGFALDFESGELVWMRIGRLSNQIAGKVTAVCIWMRFIPYVAGGIVHHVERLSQNTQLEYLTV
jgi:hypothetical protein